MFKKITSVFLLLLFMTSNAVFAIEKKDLNIDFFAKFNDDNLIYCINAAVDNNRNAKQASLRTEQYRENVKATFGKELPSFSVGANYLGVKVPDLDNFTLKKNAFILPFFANYEADFLLKNRDKTKSAKKSLEAECYNEKAVYIALLTDVATVYTNILRYDELIDTAKNNTEIYSEISKHEQKKYERGVISSSQYNDSLKNLEEAKSVYDNAIKQREILLMQLAVLTDIPIETIYNLQRGTFNEFDYNGQIPDNIDSDVIFSRPDVLAAESKLQKAQIDIKVARKEFLPTFNITGTWIFNTMAPGTFFSWDSSLAAILAGASQDIFTGGRKVANLKIQKLKYEELFEQYRQIDSEAVKEVNSALCFIKYDTEVDNNTIKKLNYENKNLNSEKQKLNAGVISAAEYLNARAKYLKIQNEVVNTKAQRLINYYTLYKAVGGKI